MHRANPTVRPRSRKRRIGRAAWLWLALAAALLLAGSAPPAAAQAGSGTVGIDRNPALFTVLCALHAAGFEEEAAGVAFHPVRRRLMPHLRQLEGPAVEKVREFYRAHLLADPGALLSRYLSLGLVIGPAPNFEFTLRRTDLPPDVRTIEGFQELLADFHSEANIEQLWRFVAAEYEEEIARLQAPLGDAVVVSTGYLREILGPASPRTFTVLVEPMVGARTHFRSYGDQYYLVVGPRRDPPVDEIRHAFLHFLLDPLAIRFSDAVRAKEPLAEIAGRAPRLPHEYKSDFQLLLTECLVRAVELRLDTPPSARLAAAIDEAERAGYILVRALHHALGEFEQSEPAMSYYYSDLLRGVRVAAEARRLADIEFTEAPVASAHPGDAEPPAATGPEAWLAEGERQIVLQDGAAAEALFARVLAEQPENPRALYGLGIAATLQGDAERAKDIFRQLVLPPEAASSSPPAHPPQVLAWAHIYLGRIYDLEGERELALSEYRAALAVPGAPESARAAAQRGIARAFEPVPRN
jgi:tetratricopeptide (TPR) repeat protein